MSTVDKETFAYWVTNPLDIGIGNMAQLEATAKAFPYCQITYSLLAKVATEAGSPRKDELVSLAAIHSLNRGSLRRLVENEFGWTESLLNRLNDFSLSRYESRDNAAPYGYEKPISLVRFDDRFTSNDLIDKEQTPEPSLTEELPLDDTAASEKVIEEELTHKRLKVLPTPAIELIPLNNPKDNERRKQQEIIEAFIKNDPRIGPIRTNKNDPGNQPVDLSHRTQAVSLDGLTTESIAKILVNQGKTDKAIKIYEKLILKNPKKKGYFTGKISELDPNR
jgi:tetratricopeptide (TPR) repeat protein